MSLAGKTIFMSGGSRGIGRRLRIRIRSWRAPSTPPPRRSKKPAARDCRSWSISGTNTASPPGGPIAIVAQAALGFADDRVAALNFSLANAAVTTLFYSSSGLSLGTLNSFQHLQQARPERLVTYR
jgi:hypothetical protein